MHGVSFKKRAPRAIKEIKGFAEKAMVWLLFFFYLGLSLLDGEVERAGSF